MSGFGFSEAQKILQREVANFARKELAPGAKQRAKQKYCDRRLVKRLGDMCLLGLNLPEKYGGQPADWVSLGIIVEEIGKVDFAYSLLPALHSLISIPLLSLPQSLQQSIIPSLISGEKMIAFALTEPDCGSDATAIKTRATRDGDTFILSGEKTSVTYGNQADVCVVFAKTDPKLGSKGISAFLISLDLPGVSISAFEDMGWIQLGRASIFLDDVTIPRENLIGQEGKGFQIAMEFFDVMRVCLSLMALALAEASLDDAIAYARSRTAFGKRISKYEGVSFKIAEAATQIEAARLLCYRTLWLCDQELPTTKEAAMCKWWCPEVAVDAIHNALLIHGHAAYSTEYPIEQRLRDAIGLEIGDGTAQIQKIIICREIIGREFV